METVSKQQLRTQETQKRLLEAAEEVFVRDGYESAQLDEIAALAGRSKGAVYVHFKSKEDLFLALFEQRTRSYIDRLAARLGTCTTRKQSVDAFRGFYLGLTQDKAWSILTLEFKLFALRHPKWGVRFRKVFELSRATNDDFISKQLFGMSQGDDIGRKLYLLALGPVVSGLILESQFEPEIFSEEGLQRVLGEVFDVLFQIASENRTRVGNYSRK